MSFESDLDALPSLDVFHTTLVDLLSLLRNLNNFPDVFLRDADNTVHISDDIISRVYRHRGEALLGTLWVDLEGNIYRRWTHKGGLTKS